MELSELLWWIFAGILYIVALVVITVHSIKISIKERNINNDYTIAVLIIYASTLIAVCNILSFLGY